VVLEIGEPPATAMWASDYMYVADVDAAYQRALRAGVTSVAEPADKSYGERNAGVKVRALAIYWWSGAYTGPN
ncbi:MAG TPA: hypothetical protein VGP82_05230, partial [Ktedonobacterales bacterium]|nr:hypothetical protein [Ktedonobacterales bacterium]